MAVMKKSIILIIGLLVFADSFGLPLWSESKITQHWQQYAADNSVAVDHDAWDKLLKRYISTVQGINLFAYNAVTSEDTNALKNYVEYLQTLTVTTLNRQQQFAYWINLYNALVVQTVLQNYPVASIQEISSTWLFKGPWRQQQVDVEGFGLSLDNIEHQIIRPIFKDNRTHYAVNCASMGCPNLQTTAFTQHNLNTLLDLGARQYINHPRGVWLNNNQLVVSSIFDWYAEDFGNNHPQIIAHLRRFADADLKNDLQGRRSIERFRYDWSLNEPR